MKKINKRNPKASSKKDFEKAYNLIMKNAHSVPAPQWGNPEDDFVKFSMYTHHSTSASSNSTN